jgi:hypothetical protein
VALKLPTYGEDVDLLIPRSPQVMALTADRQKPFIEVPLATGLRPKAAQPVGIILTEFTTPFTDRFVGHVNTAFDEERWHVSVARGETVVEPDPMADDLAWKAAMVIRLRVMSWGHVGCLPWYLSFMQVSSRGDDA